jgi:cell division protein ZipA
MMQANWSLILNVLLLIGVVVAIGRTIKTRRQATVIPTRQPNLGQDHYNYDDIIAVRKVGVDPVIEESLSLVPTVMPVVEPTLEIAPVIAIDNDDLSPKEETIKREDRASAPSLLLFLLAKENRQLAGYELLQTLLAAGLRYGEGQLFHRHQYANGQGPILCSLAAATPQGTFDLQNIGAFSVHGLCLFMEASGSPAIDAERFAIMWETAKQLREGLDTHLLDDRRKPLNDASIQRYYRLLNIGDTAESSPMQQVAQA